MGRTFKARDSEIMFDGSGRFSLNSGRLTNAAAAQFGSTMVAPCDLYIYAIHYNIDTQFTHASSKLNIGKLSDDDAFVDGIALQNVAAGYYEHDMSAASVISRFIPKGEVIAFSLDAADTTGKISATAVLVPYNPAG
jgi:hypothetical protein